MADKTMKVKFKTKTRSGGGTEPDGKVHTLPEDEAREYIKRGLAVEVYGEQENQNRRSRTASPPPYTPPYTREDGE